MVANTRHRLNRRRGVLLLIVLSLLVLFMLVGLSFLVSASQFTRLARSAAKTNEQGMPGRKLADSVMYQLVRGTSNPSSAIRGHSLLEDLYGRDYLIGRSSSHRASDFRQSGNQIHEIAFDATNSQLLLSKPSPAQLRDDYYGGCVLTFLNGPVAGQSTRIIEYKPNPPMGRILVKGVPVRMPSGSVRAPYVRKSASGQLEPLRFIINGRPFNGTGSGYNPATGSMDSGLTTGLKVPAAFMPNASFREFLSLSVPYDIGGMDESWDAVDYQNMALAKAPSLSLLAATATPPATMTNEQSSLFKYVRNTAGATPSFHRPYLIAHLASRQPIASHSDPITTAWRAASMRINRVDHPAFSGSNSNFDPIAGPWDVDNTGSGIADSVWIDAGLAPVSGPDGRLYKPLAAVHVVDMDGRLPINAADSIEHRKALQARALLPISSILPRGVRIDIDPRETNVWGAGHGPADISIPNSHANVMRDRYAGLKRRADNTGLAENYSAGAISSRIDPWEEGSTPGIGPSPGLIAEDSPLVGSDDELPANSHQIEASPWIPHRFRTDNSVGNLTQAGTGFGSPTDLQVRSVPYLDPLGNIVWVGRNTGNFDGLDDPYEINLLKDTPHDRPYDLSDLEAMLRSDATYRDKSRIRNALRSGTAEESNLDNSFDASVFTTHSFSIPALPGVSPGRFRAVEGLINPVNRGGTGVTNSLRDMFAAKIKRITPSMSYEEAFQRAGRLMAPEFKRGEKLNLNKVLVPNTSLSAAEYAADPIGAEAVQEAITHRKQVFARHLFHLMMLLADDDLVLPNVDHKRSQLGDFPARAGGRSAAKEVQIRRIAQWAVNVVDFGDADSVSTHLVFDANPFNDFDAINHETGEFITDYATREERLLVRNRSDLRSVWGMEHPELLMTETLAFHDRRAEDTTDDPSGKNLRDNDPHLDSIDVPEGSAFVELYCPRSPQPRVSGFKQATARGPEDLWTSPPALDKQQLDLSKIVGPNPATPNYQAKPVWRLALSEITFNGAELRDQDTSNTNDPPFALEQAHDTSQFEPDGGGGLAWKFNDPLNALQLRRFVWFTAPLSALPETEYKAFPNANRRISENQAEETARNTYYFTGEGSTRVGPAHYVVVRPNDVARTGTHVGRTKAGEKSEQRVAANYAGGLGNRFQHSQFRKTNFSNTANIRGPIEKVVPIAVSTSDGDRFSISEPVGGYDRGLLPSDVPLDNIRSEIGNVEESPLYEDPENPQGLLATGVKPNFRTVFLQRLANPNLPWNPQTNPYLTIDWMQMDLHVINSAHGVAGDLAEDGNDDVEKNWNFASRERTGIRDLKQHPILGTNAPVDGALFNIWSAWSSPCSRSEQDRGYGEGLPNSTRYSDSCNTNVAHSLGFLNRSYDYTGGRTPFDGVGDGRGHYRRDVYPEAPIALPDRDYITKCFSYSAVTDQATRQKLINYANANFLVTYPSLVWHNRPYANPYELLLVPATSNARLGVEYTVSQSTSPYASPNERAEHRGAFGHLLNFFHSSTGNPNEPVMQTAANYFRIFDYMHVPSRFKGTRTYWNQNALGADNPFRKVPLSRNQSTASYIDRMTSERPELLATGELAWRSSSVSAFREPGKVNINTAPWSVWPELGFNSALKTHSANRHAAFELTLAGYDYPRIELPRPTGSDVDVTTSDGVSKFSGRYPNGLHPAEYPNPLRNGTTADLMPRLPGTGGSNLAIDATMLRSGAPRVSGALQPVLGNYVLQASATAVDTEDQVDAFAIQNRKTNAYFRYKDLFKLGNSITSQSNVYAIWVTIGYFEIEPNVGPNGEMYHVDQQHSDGYRYGVELGSDLGQVTRHRSFYIVDRSIPVAFEPGTNHNVDNAIVVRRELE